jgi:hypothetical protein
MTPAIWSIGCDALQKACTVLTNYRELPILAIDSDPWHAACRFDNLYHSLVDISQQIGPVRNFCVPMNSALDNIYE